MNGGVQEDGVIRIPPRHRVHVPICMKLLETIDEINEIQKERISSEEQPPRLSAKWI